MQYKIKKNKDNKDEFFMYKPKFNKNKKQDTKKIGKNNPFNKLSELRFR